MEVGGQPLQYFCRTQVVGFIANLTTFVRVRRGSGNGDALMRLDRFFDLWLRVSKLQYVDLRPP